MSIQANESAKSEVLKIRTVPLDIRAILDVIAKRKYSFKSGEINCLNLSRTDLRNTNLRDVNLSGADLSWAHFEGADLGNTELSAVKQSGAHLEGADPSRAYLNGAYLEGANFEGANLEGANLEVAQHLSFDQLSKVKTLYKAKLDEELKILLQEKYHALFEEPK
jgi:uncharacterized protein YjbI with pentapeptide repeats